MLAKTQEVRKRPSRMTPSTRYKPHGSTDKRRGYKLADGVLVVASARENFSFNLHLWLLTKNMSFADLARATGATQSQISKWRTLKQFPGPEGLDKISRALSIPVSYLFLNWETFFEQQNVSSLSPELDVIKHSGVPAALRDNNIASAISQLSKMVSTSASVSKGLLPPLPSVTKKPS
jgi:transcriptional regulator with XRE-family HTH domain